MLITIDLKVGEEKRNLPSQHDSTGSLDVVVEALVLVTVTVEVVESLLGLKVLELHDHIWVDLLGGGHELVGKCLLLSNGWALLAESKVELILQVGLIVGTAVQHDRQGLAGVDTGGRSVKSQLANGDSNTVKTKVTETQDTRAISDDADLRVWVGPVLEDGLDGLSLLNRDIQGLWAGVEGGVLQANITNSRRVNEGHHLLAVIHEQAVEEIGILLFDRRQVEVLVYIGLAGANHAKGTLTSLLKVLNLVRDQASEVLLSTVFW